MTGFLRLDADAVLAPGGNRLALAEGTVIDTHRLTVVGSTKGGESTFSDDGSVLSQWSNGQDRTVETDKILRYAASDLRTLPAYRTCMFSDVTQLAALPDVLGVSPPDRYGVQRDGRFVTFYGKGEQATIDGTYDPVAFPQLRATPSLHAVYDPAIVLADKLPFPGRPRQQRGFVEYRPELGGFYSLAYEATTQVFQRERVTVPAGTFDAFRVTLRLRIFGEPSYTRAPIVSPEPVDRVTTETLWIAPGVGIVKRQSGSATETLRHFGVLADDSDGDGVVRSADACPARFDPAQGDLDRDGRGDACDDDDDGDGLSDEVELAVGLDPRAGGDAAEDADGDGASNREELRRGTDPFFNEAAILIPVLQLLLD